MSNAIDFYRTPGQAWSIPSGRVCCKVDGQSLGFIEVEKIVRAGWPEFNRASLVYRPGEQTEIYKTTAGVEELIYPGAKVSIDRIFNSVKAGVRISSLPIFSGEIEKIEKQLDAKGQRIRASVRDCSMELERITVYGRRVLNNDGSTVFIKGQETAFNDGGEPNASADYAEANGRQYNLFSGRSKESVYWQVADAIYYLLCEYVPIGYLQIVDIEQLKGLTEGDIAWDIDVTGLSLLEALRRCCEAAGLKFKFMPRYCQSGAEEAIVFYKTSTGGTVVLGSQQKGQELSTEVNDIWQMRGESFGPMTHKYIGQGDFKVFESTFELVKGWDGSLEGTNYDQFSPSSNAEFYKVKDVYRKWVLNESGNYSDSPYNQGQAYDFSKVFGTMNYIQRVRRFYPTLSRDKNDKSLGYFLEVSYDGGQSWRQYMHAFNVLLEECGIWLSSDQLGVETWIAALKDNLCFRITASVVSDERLSCEFFDGPINSTIAVTEQVVMLPREHKFRKVTTGSVFHGQAGKSLGWPDERNDSEALREQIRKQAVKNAAETWRGRIRTMYLLPDYQVGNKVTSNSSGTDLLGCRAGRRGVSIIERVEMDFKRQFTELEVVRKRGIL